MSGAALRALHVRAGRVSGAALRALHVYREAGADCVYPIGVADEAMRARVEALLPVVRAAQPPR